MGNAAKYIVSLPMLAEFTFHTMMKCSPEVKATLSELERSYFKRPDTIRRFADKESVEKRLLLLARMGYPFAVLVAPVNEETKIILEELPTQFKFVGKRDVLMKAMQRNDMFAFTSREILLTAEFASMNCHARAFELNPAYLKMQQRFAALRADAIIKDTKLSADGFDMLAEVLREVFRTYDSIPVATVFTHYELKIMLTLFNHRNTYVSNKRVGELIDVSPRAKKGVSMVTHELEKRGYVHILKERDSMKNTLRSYTITGKGIVAVMDYMKQMIKKAMF